MIAHSAMRLRGRPWSLGAAVLGAALLAGTPASASDTPDWFRYGEIAAAAWQVSAVPDDPLRVMIRPKTVDPDRPLERVMVLYPKPSSAYDTAITKILEVFQEKGVNAELTALNFQMDDELGAAALQLAEDESYDLIFSMGSQSTAWLHQYYRGGAVPVVSVCSKDPVALGQIESYDVGTGTNLAFTSLNMPIEVELAYLLDFKPELKNLAILVNSKNISAVRTQSRPMAARARERGIEVLEVAVQNPKHARDELADLVASSVATMRLTDPSLDHSVFWITGSTAVFREMETINANADRVPVLSVVPEVVQAGDASAVMSIGISFESNAHLAAVYGVDILSGRVQAGDLPVGVVSPPDIAISFRRAREIGLEIPLAFFESATYVYDYEGRAVRQGASTVWLSPAS